MPNQSKVKVYFELTGNVSAKMAEFSKAIAASAATMQGHVSSINVKIKDSADKATSSSNKLTKNLANKYGSLKTGIFSFRSDIEGFNNKLLNSIAVGIRGLARLRTAAFLLVTVFAVRPVFRFFDELVAASTEATRRIEKSQEQFKFKMQEFAIIFEPLKKIFNEMIELFKTELLNAFIKLAPFIGRLARAIGDVAALVYVFIDALKVLQLTLDGIFYSIDRFVVGLSVAWFDFLTTSGNSVVFFADKVATEMKFLTKHMPEWVRNSVGSVADYLQNDIPQQVKFAKDALQLANKELNALETKSLRDTKGKGYATAITDAIREAVGRIPEILGRETPLQEFFLTLDTSIQEAAAKLDAKMDELATAANARHKAFLATTAGQIVANLNVFVDEFNKATKSLTESFAQFAQDSASAFKNAFSDVFFNIMEGKFNKFRDIIINFLNGIKRAIANFLAEQVTRELIGRVLGAVAGGIGGLITGQGVGAGASYGAQNKQVSTTPHQHGGVVTGSSMVPAGEAGPEAFVPLHGNKIPVRIEGGGSGRPVQVNFNINAIDGPSTAAWFAKNKAQIKKIFIEAAAGEDMAVRRAYKLA